jgi:uncharacterized protein YjeT (DUF2065 family)
VIARSGNTIYASVYDRAEPEGPGAIITIDLVTNTQTGSAFITPRVLFLAATDGDGDVFGTESIADGSVWKLHPGSAPVALVQHRPFPAYVAADATHVYWSENTTPGSPEHVVRRAIAGGPIEPVMTCGAPNSLHVAGGYVYCSGQSHLVRHLVDGTGSDEGIPYPLGYPIFAAMVEGVGYFFAPMSFTQMILRVDNTSTNAATVVGAGGSRIASLSATADYFYTVDFGYNLRRTHRTTGIEEVVHPFLVNHDTANQYAIEWNNQLYFDAQDYNLGGVPYLMHCVD